MSLSEQARELAGKIDKATPGPWKYRESHDAIDVLEGESANYYRICRHILDDGVNGEAICLARNEAPALLRQLADENERLQRVVNQAVKIGRVKMRDDQIHAERTWCYAFEVPELAEELQRREAQ